MNHRFLSLALAGALSLTLLAGCGGNGESVAPSEEVTPPQASESVQPSESPLPSESLQPEVSEEPSESVTPSEEPVPSAQATSKPSAAPTTKPTTKPTAQPTPPPTQAPADASTVLNSVWTDISKNEMPALIDLDSDTLSAVYSISSSDLEAYICKMPMMATHATEFFIAKVKDGKMDTVKAAVEKRQDDLEAQWSQYLPEQLELVKNYKLVTNGNYILFAVSDQVDSAVSAFNTYTK